MRPPTSQYRAPTRSIFPAVSGSAASRFVGVAVVRQRLRLASVSLRLLDVYAEDGMTLDQLMAFSVSPDHERQEQVWEAVQRSYSKEPYQIRRMLTEGAVRASDKRAQYAGEAYVIAGGEIMRDLFERDDGGWLQDVGLLERLVAEKLDRDAEAVRAEGWKWVEVATDFPYGHTYGLRSIIGESAALTDEEQATVTALQAEAAELEETYAAAEELPEDVDQRFGEIETALGAFEDRPTVYDPAEIGRAGVFVSIDGSGKLRIERGYVRAEDEPPVSEPEAADGEIGRETEDGGEHGAQSADDGSVRSEPSEEDDGMRPLPDKLLTELTAHRTLALREAIGADPATAYLAVLHVLCLKLFYRYGLDSCLEIEAKSVAFSAQAPGLADTGVAMRVDDRHRAWVGQLPEDSGQLWDALTAFDTDSREALFAHCVSLTVNGVHEAWSRRPKALAHADRLAELVSLDMVAAGWTPGVDNYLGRVTKARIVDAVREAKGEPVASGIGHLKKGEMATSAEQLLAGSGWLPEPLRTPGRPLTFAPPEQAEGAAQTAVVETAAPECATVVDPDGDQRDPADGRSDPHAIAAE